MFKTFVTKLLEHQAKRLLKKYKPKIVAVTGSVGKTSTKLAIATVLSKRYKVLAHYGSYNTPIALPLAMFDMHIPVRLRHPMSWLKVYMAMGKKLKQPYPYQVLVLELGTDAPGDIGYFKKYIKPDIAVITAVAEEHMEFFGTLEAVAQEELSVSTFSNLTLINRDDVSAEYSKYVPSDINIDTYGTSGVAEYHFLIDNYAAGDGFSGKFVSPEYKQQPVKLRVVGEHNIRSAVAAGTVGIKMGLSADQIAEGLQDIRPVSGRMNLLRGMEETTIIDDTYNASPIAVIAALQTLYSFPAPQHIAILGSMNELGAYSKEAHEQVGKACDPGLLDWVITIGAEAEKYLAPAAQARGCRVRSFMSPYDAGAEAHKLMQAHAVILAKGSQNRVFAEEAVKVILHSTQEESQLVRQSPDWMAIKEKQFGKFQNVEQ
jgi:UDP-N-acetylmuramoyl-tripeptide--D-alanyl-D-alanine ligase